MIVLLFWIRCDIIFQIHQRPRIFSAMIIASCQMQLAKLLLEVLKQTLETLYRLFKNENLE